MAELLVWPALIAYSEAAVAYAGELRGPGVGGRLGTWGVRVGWLAQTGLLVAQATSADGFPWGTWAGALNLLSWLVVSVYLVWGCRPRFKLLGLCVMPVAAGLLLLAWLGGGTGIEPHERSGALLALHVALMLGGFAALTVASAMGALYLWEERRLKRRDSGVLRLRLPPLETLERVATRVTLASLVALSAGIVVGGASLGRGDVDLTMAVTVVIWASVVVGLILRREAGLQARRWMGLLCGGLVLVAVVLPLTHFAS